MATEFAALPLKEGIKLEDTSSDAGKTWAACFQTISSQKGYQRCSWGYQIENPSVVTLLIDWGSVDDHGTFMGSPEYQPFLVQLGQLLSGPVTPYHAHLSPFPPTAALSKTTSPVTEIVTFYFKYALSAAETDSFNDAFSAFDAVLKEAAGHTATSSGWTVEGVEHDSLSEHDKAYVAAIGWESVDAHMKFRETDPFKESIVALRDKASVIGMYHVSFNAL